MKKTVLYLLMIALLISLSGCFGQTPSGSPAESAAPAAETAAPAASAVPSPVHTSTPARRNTGVNTVVKVFFVIALLSLAALAAYVWYLRQQGLADEGDYEVPHAKPSETLARLYSRLVKKQPPQSGADDRKNPPDSKT